MKDGKHTNPFGNEFWYKDDILHREDGPAVTFSNGDEEWWSYGRLHRLGGPALIYNDGEKYWYRFGKQHREDGPAVIYSNGEKLFFYNGHLMTFQNWFKTTTNEGRISFLFSGDL